MPANEAALKHGLRRYQDHGTLPADLRSYIDSFRAELIADQGGDAELTAIRAGLVDKLCQLEVGVRLLMAEVVLRGIDSRPGKTAWASALRTIETWHRIASTLGLERRQRPIPSLEAELERIRQQQAGSAPVGDINAAELNRRRSELEGNP